MAGDCDHGCLCEVWLELLQSYWGLVSLFFCAPTMRARPCFCFFLIVWALKLWFVLWLSIVYHPRVVEAGILFHYLKKHHNQWFESCLYSRSIISHNFLFILLEKSDWKSLYKHIYSLAHVELSQAGWWNDLLGGLLLAVCFFWPNQ